jgi:hypothetical protein
VVDVPFSELGEFVFHCHILEHEDGGMMAKIRVVLGRGAAHRKVTALGQPANTTSTSGVAQIGFAACPSGLGDDPPLAVPALGRLPSEVLEAARRFFGLLAVLLRRSQFALDLPDQPAVLGQAE